MTISEFDKLPKEVLQAELSRCCGSAAWVSKMIAVLPVEDLVDLLEYAEEKWYECTEADWLEAFSHHPKIGNVDSLKPADQNTAVWAKNEQAGVANAADDIKQRLAEGNLQYQEKFGYIFIIKATGKSAEEMLHALETRLNNSPEDEVKIAMEEQLKITKLRLQKWLMNE